jgi:formate/nitrite transporter FocA (FNT family)
MSFLREERRDEQNTFKDIELAEIESQSTVRPPVIFEVIRRQGEEEMRRPVSALALSGVAAGFAIGFSLLAEALIRASLPDSDWRPLVENLGYTVGYLIVILGQMQLFTENTITPVASVLIRPQWKIIVGLTRLWGVVLATNFIGTFAFALLMRWDGIIAPEAMDAMLAISSDATGYGFRETLIRAIPAGWLIAALVWIMPSADQGRALIIIALTYLIALAGFSHVVAGSAKVALVTLSGHVAVSSALSEFLLPALIGNILGGSALFTVLVWGQIRTEFPAAEELNGERQ